MKTILYFLFVILMLSSCKKKYCWVCEDYKTRYKYRNDTLISVESGTGLQGTSSKFPGSQCGKTKDEAKQLERDGTFNQDYIEINKDSIHLEHKTTCTHD